MKFVNIEFLSEDNIAFSGFPLFQSPDPSGSRAQIWLVFIMDGNEEREASFKTDRMITSKFQYGYHFSYLDGFVLLVLDGVVCALDNSSLL